MVFYDWVIVAFNDIHFMRFAFAFMLIIMVAVNVMKEKENSELIRRNIELKNQLGEQRQKINILKDETKRLNIERWRLIDENIEYWDKIYKLKKKKG